MFCKFGVVTCHNCEYVKLRQKELEKKMEEMIRNQEKTNTKVDQIKENLDEMKVIMLGMRLSGVKPDITVTESRQAIIVAGGHLSFDEPPTRTAEVSSLPDVTWSDIALMNDRRGGAASCVHDDELIVTGGGPGGTNMETGNTMEVLKVNQRPLRWTMLNAKLPGKFFGHRVVIYRGKLLVIGGYDYSERRPSNAIHEVLLTPPYTIKLLCRMPEPRVYHRIQLVNGKLFILGGATATRDEDSLDSVIVYDIEKNKCQPCSPLPFAVHHMSAVTWGSNVILLGGTDKEGNSLNDVTIYDTETQTTTKLPPMRYARRGSSAVIFHDRIFVMSGRNENEGYLYSVESLKIGDDRWQQHEDLGTPRHVAIAHGFNVPV